MAKHLMAVCVVCLLCAEHLPCKEHIDNTELISSKNYFSQKLNIPFNEFTNNIYDDTKDNNKLLLDKNYVVNIKEPTRKKRHADHFHEESYKINVNSKLYTKKIFEQFSHNNNNKEMDIKGFNNLLRKFHFYSLYNESDNCISTSELLHHLSSQPEKFEKSQQNKNIENNSSIIPNINANKTEIKANTSENELSHPKLNTTKSSKYTSFLNHEDFISACPVILYHILGQSSDQKSGCIKNGFLTDVAGQETIIEDRVRVWIYSSLSILGVSLCGLLGVAVIPCMENRFYNQLLQFLVALAVGTLTGDALLHLLPHSFMASSGSENPHQSMIIKGLIAVLGVIFFFFTERVLTMIADCRKNRQKKEKPCSRVRVMRDITMPPPNVNGEKICKNKYSSYPYCYDEIAMETRDDNIHHHHAKNNCEKTPSQPQITPPVENNKHNNKSNCIQFRNHDHGDHNETAQSLLSFNYAMNDNYTPDSNNPNKELQTDNNTISTNLDDGSVNSLKEQNVTDENYTIILREHESKHHGHSHTHGHVHSPPKTLSAVAWMVVMGDGLHNFTDGMTIGAAFSNNIAGGFSTAIAVFCHELPHELGDFAVLLKAGMSAKQAVYYNILSSVLSFFGMILGVLIGEQEEASSWIFACAAGMFIYIALVDMMPEITASHKDAKHGLSQCFLQLLGMLLGLGIMLLIAFYEDDLKVMFKSDHNHHSHHDHE